MSVPARPPSASPQAKRLTRPSWSDSRVVVGVLLVLASVVLGARIVASARATTPVYRAVAHLVPGQAVTSAELAPTQVNLGEVGEHYLSAERTIPASAVALREVRSGELVEKDAIAEQRASRVRPVMLPVEYESASVLVSGSVVDVWVNRRLGTTPERYGSPTLVLSAAAVSRAPQVGTGQLSGTRSTSGVQVMVPADAVADLIAAVDQGARVTLIPMAGSVQRGAG